ncbi:hypothetical protein [Schnuerera ultunensis]|uniref:Uncharacterized protein n=1 Tax=[Clostridium] ultunense Esp TaxID=1288971 RepID=A0A1M4PS40_9FIRM|nr:hypothetical protein [Schnuerera ultunensis]SHD78329.1 protein of unknown function [[Clostridium] ultunense Esp]
MENFIHELYEELIDTPINKEELDNWIDIVGEHIEDVEFVLYSEEEDKELLELAIELQKWRILTTSLIMGDRFNVKNVESTWITKTDNSRYVENIDRFCSQNRDQPLSVVRMKAQEDIMRQLKENPNQLFYTLCMPTGERVIIVMGAVNVMKPRVSGTLNKYILCIA